MQFHSDGILSQSSQFPFGLRDVYCRGPINAIRCQEPTLLKVSAVTGLKGQLWGYKWGSVAECQYVC